jgi:hypothetical protein
MWARGETMESAPIAEPAPLAKRQRGVALGAGLALMATIALVWFGSTLTTDRRSAAAVFAMAAFGPLVSLIAAFGSVANTRFFSAQDIDAGVGGPPSDAVRVRQAILQNTLEQAVLALGVYGILAILGSALPLAMALAFVLGRIAFVLGYSRGAAGRAFGFGLTAYPNVIGLIYAAYLAWTFWA